jgi:hypothetical protein
MPDDNAKSATKADISLLRAELATKTELAAVKTELREDIVRLDKKIDRVAVEMVKTQGQMQQMEERINAKMDTRFNQVLSAIDSFAKKSENKNTAVTLHGSILTEVQVGLKDHEGRLKTLESARP